MQKLFTTLAFTFFCIMVGIAQQHPTCDGERYLTPVFDDFTKTSDIKFGENTTVGGNDQEFFLDVFEPTGDDATARPLIVFAHGGSFVAGTRQDMNFLCEEFAKRGFVTATIDYRLLDAFVFDSISIIEVVVDAMSDMKAGIRYFREDAATENLFKIDTNLIFAGGISAGGIMASHIAYVDVEDDIQTPILGLINSSGGFSGNSSTNTQYSSEVVGVLNYSGALKEAKWVDENDPPLFSVHDDGDNVVPYGNGLSVAFPFGNYLEGSATMKVFADAAGLNNELITISNSGGHVSYFADNAAEYQEDVIQASAVFLHDIFCDMVSNVANNERQLPKFTLSPNPTSEAVNLKISDFNGAYDVAIFNMNGQQIYQQKNIFENILTLNVEGFNNGMYVIKVEFLKADVTPILQKLIVQR